MRQPLFKLAGVTAMAAGLALGQSAPAPNPHTKQGMAEHMRGQAGSGMMLDRLTGDLNLTDSQKQQAQSIFQAARQSAEPVNTQLRQNRQALNTAVKSGASDAEIDKLANNLAPQVAQVAAIHTKAMAKLYKILTPEQQTKFSERLDRMNDSLGAMRGRRPGSQYSQPQPSR